MNPSFIHLHLHTEYSIKDGLISIKPLMEAVKNANMPAVAMTDLCNLFAMVKFYRAAIAAGIKPIMGADILIHNETDPKSPSRLVLLCQNQTGYRNLTRLISKTYIEGQTYGAPILHKSWLQGATEGLIALSGGKEGDIGQALLSHQQTIAEKLLSQWLVLFPDRFYLELQRTGRECEEAYIQSALALAHSFDVPVVATNDVRFLSADDFDAHEARTCIHGGWILDDERRPHFYSDQQYLRTPQEMATLFADIPQSLINSVEIAKRCNLELTLGKYFLPNFPVPAGMSVYNYFEQQSRQGLDAKLQKILGKKINEQRQGYDQRLQMEIDVIEKMGFTGYFLIVADFVHWSKKNNIPVGPGRGSGAGSLVAYALGITDLDPLQHELLFERFLNPERVSVADFDIDFCMEGRDRVIEYVTGKYGRESVSQIITFGTMAARAVVRDVGRVLGYPYGFVDKIAKLIPFELGMTLEKALKDEPQLLQRYRDEDEVKALIDLALKLEGAPRNVGKHAGGVVIASSVLTDFTPIYCEADGRNPITQFDKDDVEAVGLVKFDFLGLRTLTIIDWTLQAVNFQSDSVLDISLVPLDDKKTYQLLRACDTTAVFQLESRGMRDLVKRLQPDCFDDIVALVALFRPGPLQSGMVDDYINRKHGRARVDYPHPKLESVLRPTYGVILYQEQVMQIAQVLAGYTLGAADLLRRAMGKKKLEEMAKQRAIFVSGAEKNGVTTQNANAIFDLMEKFADYGFNKSHSVAYALLAYQTAWLKAHYPAQFMAAVLSSDMDNTDKVVRFIEDCQRMKLKVNAPTINQSQYRFTVAENGEIVYGLGAIKGVGFAAVENILSSRSQGEFSDLFEFCERVDLRRVNRKVIEAFIFSGAMDCFQVERATLQASVEAALQMAEQHARNEIFGQNDLFGEQRFATTPLLQCEHYIKAQPLSEETRLNGEKTTLGWYISGHPIMRYERELMRFTTSSIIDLRPVQDQLIMVAGYVTQIRTLYTKTGNRMAVLMLDDHTARIDVTIFSDIYDRHRELLNADQLLVIEGEVNIDDFTGNYRVNAQRIYNLMQAREKFAKKLVLTLATEQFHDGFVKELKDTLNLYRGGQCPIHMVYRKDKIDCVIAVGAQWKVRLDEKMLKSLSDLCGENSVYFEYGVK